VPVDRRVGIGLVRPFTDRPVSGVCARVDSRPEPPRRGAAFFFPGALAAARRVFAVFLLPARRALAALPAARLAAVFRAAAPLPPARRADVFRAAFVFGRLFRPLLADARAFAAGFRFDFPEDFLAILAPFSAQSAALTKRP
jgi:hypothetical protein